MRLGRRRWLAAAAVVAAVGVTVVVLGATSARPAAESPSVAAPAASNSRIVTVPNEQFDAPDPPSGGGAGETGGLPTVRLEDAGRGREVDGTDGRDYSIAPTFDAPTFDDAVDPSVGSSVAAADAQPWPPPPPDPTAAVAVAVAAAGTEGVHQAVVVIDRSTGATLTQQDADEPFPALSLVKLMIAADVLHGSGTGTTADDATRAWMREMIATSDDVTAADFYDAAGGDELVDRVVQRFGLTGTSPTPDGEYWGNVQTTAGDLALLVRELLADPVTADVVGPAMLAATAIAADGVDQRFGMRAVPGAGSKQGWGCCLSGVTGIHSMGFTPERIVVVLSSAETDDESLAEQDGLALQADPGAQVSIAAVTDTVRAALGGPASS